MAVLLKGFRLDMPKIAKAYGLKRGDMPEKWITDVIHSVPRDSYHSVQTGYDFNSRLNVMFVTEHGFEEKLPELMKSPVTCSDKVLADMTRKLCTPGIWPLYDRSHSDEEKYLGIEDLDTFWKRSGSLKRKLKAWNKPK